MDKQNSKDSNNSRLHPFVILQHGLEVKKTIQDEIFKLIGILKKREHDLCLEVDQLCLELLYEAEESEKAGTPVLNDPNCKVDTPKQYLKKQDLLTTKLMFHGNFKNSQLLLKTYGRLRKFDCAKNAMSNPVTNIQPCTVWNWWEKYEQGKPNYGVSVKPIQPIVNCGRSKAQNEALKQGFHFIRETQDLKFDEVERNASYAGSLKNEGINCDKTVKEELEKDFAYNRELQDFQMFKVLQQNSFENEQDDSGSPLKMAEDRATASLKETWALFSDDKNPYSSFSANQTSQYRMPKDEYWLKPLKETCPLPACTYSMQKENEWLAIAGRKFPETSTDAEMQASSRDSYIVVNPPESSNEQDDSRRHTKVVDRATASFKETWASFRDKYSYSSSSANQTSFSRMPKDDYWLKTIEGTCPSPACSNSIQKENEWLADAKQKLSEPSTHDEMQALSRDSLCVVNPPESANEMAGGDHPQNTIKACFGEYLRQDDLELWLSSNRSSEGNDGSQSCSEDEDFEICSAPGFCKVKVDVTDDMIDSFCFIPPESRRKTET